MSRAPAHVLLSEVEASPGEAGPNSRVICIERPSGTGYVVEYMFSPDNHFVGTIGLRVEPGAPGSDITFRRPSGALPLVYYNAVEETVFSTLREGLLGWQEEACHVTLTDTAYDR